MKSDRWKKEKAGERAVSMAKLAGLSETKIMSICHVRDLWKCRTTMAPAFCRRAVPSDPAGETV